MLYADCGYAGASPQPVSMAVRQQKNRIMIDSICKIIVDRGLERWCNGNTPLGEIAGFDSRPLSSINFVSGT